MDEKTPRPMTPFDELVTSPQLQVIKLLLPYAPVSQQRILAAFIKLFELRQTILFFNGFRHMPEPDGQGDSADASDNILKSIRPYLDPGQAEMMDMAVNMRDIMDMAEMMRSSADENGSFDPAEMMLGMLSPEQKEMFETYSAMFSQPPDNTMKGDDSSE